ncbi:MAG: HD-GYP domain-containing protein [Bacillus sp. (in: Bacteria)]|nr:HD-GYP domain-containing protein [Bacillus sp. (in: firmicutes)]MCM1426980.1 HD-GYP domain-containing protein [Eubacterium sp.]
MITEILEILETTAITIGGFLIKKYVFLEPDMEPKKQRNFYIVSFLMISIVFLAFGKDIASLAALFMIELNICFSRDKHKLRSLVLLIPFLGIINGLLLPVLFVPPYLLSLSVQGTFVYQFAAYGLLFVLLVIFYVKGKNWRNWFYENMQNRKLRKSETYLLWMVGILMLFFSNVVAKQILEAGGSTGTADKLYGQEFVLFVGISSISAFIMSITIIVLIMQGNKRSFYHEQVSNMQSGMITFMAEVVENRDDNTGGHIRRTAEYVECIAKELKRRGMYGDVLTDRYLNDMVVAAPLHDIGKIHIPDAVLNKPGKLTDEEFEVMKTHTTAGEELLTHAKEELGESKYLNTALEMAAYHHEWWNGKGYPYGISGEEIPLCARIMAVADVFDALTSKRCYKNAMPLEKAYAIIREETGTHFDPTVVEAFFAANIGMGT